MKLVPCRNCGRNFEADSLARHEPICAHLNKRKKRVFNSYKQRAEGTDIESVRGSSVGKRLGPPVSNWRQQHQEFLDTIRNARVATHTMKKGLPLPPPPPPATNPDYIECPYCNRRFNETAVERHINFCRTNVNRKMTARQNPQPEALPSKLKVQMASRRVPDPRGAEAIPSTSQRLPRGPPATSGPSIYPLSSVRQAQQGKLTAAAQAVMGIRADYDSPPTVRAPDTVRVGARGHPPTQTSRHSRM